MTGIAVSQMPGNKTARKILVVEDEAIIAQDIKIKLNNFGYSVCDVAYSGQQAIDKSLLHEPDLILMDILLRGEMDGVEAATTISKHMNVPIVYLTAYADRQTTLKVKESKPYGYLLKPFQAEELYTTVENALYRHQADSAQRENQRWLYTTLKTIEDAVITADSAGKIILMNPAAEALTGQRQNQVLGRSVDSIIKLVDEESNAPIENLVTLPLHRGISLEIHHNGLLINRAGQEIPVTASTSPILDDNGSIIGVVLVMRNITERKRLRKSEENFQKLQNRLFEIKKMDSIGRLAGGIAHDFNNLLTSILGYAALIKLHVDEEKSLSRYINILEEDATRAAALTAKLLGFARGGTYNRKDIMLNRIITDTLHACRKSFDGHIHLKTDLVQPSPFIVADALQLQQVLMNFFDNAREAMPNGGVFQVQTALADLSQKALIAEGALPAGKYARIILRDTGRGMDAAMISKIFEPFFTTKKSTQSSGLGLSMAYGVIKNLSGFIHVESKPGEGTTFKIFIPAIEKRQSRKSAPSTRQPLSGGNETILVVDDEESIRSFTRDLLERYGYKTYLAADGIEALEIYRELESEISLVVLDMFMPRKNGYDTLLELMAINPAVKVLVATGHSDASAVQEALEAGARDFINKPYTILDFMTKLRELIEMTP